jgi:hypothetical protein
MAALEADIQQASVCERRQAALPLALDGRVKPGHDE